MIKKSEGPDPETPSCEVVDPDAEQIKQFLCDFASGAPTCRSNLDAIGRIAGGGAVIAYFVMWRHLLEQVFERLSGQ